MSGQPLGSDGDKPRRISLLDRIFMSPACIRFDVLVTCPDADLSSIRKLSLAIWLSGTWTCLLFAGAAKIMLSPAGEWSVIYVAVAALVTAIVVLADILIFIAASWHAHGVAELARTGQFHAYVPLSARVKGGVLIASRFAMALLTANFLAVIASLLAFQPDTDKIIEAWYQRNNSVLFREGAVRSDGELRKSVLQQEEIRRSVAEAEKAEGALRTTIVDPTADEPEWRVALAAVSRTETAKADAERALSDAEGASADEVGGTCERRGRACAPGRGPRWRAAQERIASAQRAAVEATRAFEAAQRKLSDLRILRSQDLGRKSEAALARLAEVSTNKQSQQARLAELTEKYQSMLSNRERSIKDAVESDPRHVPRENGLVAHLRALKELMKEPAVAAWVYVFEGMLMFLELAAVMGKAVTFVPMTYATKLAELDLTRAYDAARRLRKVMSDAEPMPPQPSEGPERTPRSPRVQPEESAPQTNATIASLRSRRHAPRWQPPFGSGGGQISPDDGRSAPGLGPTNPEDRPPSSPPPA